MGSTEDDKVRIRIAEIMSSAGLGYNQISLEILYLIPKDFVDAYIAIWEAALGPAGGGDARGQQLTRDANLGKHKTEVSYKGKRVGAGGGGGGKKFKKIFVIRDEDALVLKAKIDKRLRNAAREMMLYLDGSRHSTLGDGGEAGEGGEGVRQCSGCGKIMGPGWRYCPNDGLPIRARIDRKGDATND